MASPFYKRFVPSQLNSSDHTVLPHIAKKRKTNKSASGTSPQKPKPRDEVRENLSSNVLEKADKQFRSQDTEAFHDEYTIRERHKTVLNKYDQAAKKSAESKDGRIVLAENEEGEEQEDPMEVELHGLEPLPQPAPVEDNRKVSAFSALPEWLQAPVLAPSADTVPFRELALYDDILTSLEKRGYSAAFAIQSAVLPMLLPGRKHYSGDICISAATGSGKTLAYVLPMVHSLHQRPVTMLRGLIVVPTRELVSQVKDTLDLCCASTGLKIATAVGSKSLKEEQAILIEKGQRYDPEAYKAEQEKEKEVDEGEELMDWDFDKKFGSEDDLELFYNHVIEYRSKVDILICTPGRLVEHIQTTTGFSLEHVQWLVIDEADRLLDESFQQWVDVVRPGLERLPPRGASTQPQSDFSRLFRRREVRKIILSATMTRDISKLMTLNLKRPKLIVLEGSNQRTADDEGDAAIEDEGGRVQLPASLQEYGVPIPEHHTQYKPLYLISLLESDPDPIPRITHQSSPTASSSGSEASTPSEDDSQDSTAPSPSESATAPPLQPPTPPPTHGTLIFTSSNESAHRLSRLLALLRPSWTLATITKSTGSRHNQNTLAQFRQRKLSILIASDRASRGLDVRDLKQVVNYDMPRNGTSYVHRVGRTARAGREGRAVTLVEFAQGKWFWRDEEGIAGSRVLGRGEGRRVLRRKVGVDVGGEGGREYERALERLGVEARG